MRIDTVVIPNDAGTTTFLTADAVAALGLGDPASDPVVRMAAGGRVGGDPKGMKRVGGDPKGSKRVGGDPKGMTRVGGDPKGAKRPKSR